MVRRVEVRGVKSLRAVALDLGPLTVLVGPNGCGKTTLLEEVARACRMGQPGGWNDNFFGRFGAEVASVDWGGKFSYQGGGEIEWKIFTGVGEIGFECKRDVDVGLDLRIVCRAKDTTHHTREQPNGPVVEQVLVGAKVGRPLHLNLSAASMGRVAPIQEERALAGTGAGLPALLAHLAINEHETYLAIQEDLRAVVPHFERLYLPQIRVEGGIGYGLNLHMRGAGRIAAGEVSEGTLLALGLLTAIHADGLAELVLIDDVDRGLHLGAQSRVLKAIRRVLERRPGLQVVMTTHSPYLLQEVEASEVRVMGLDAGGCSHLRRLDEHPKYERWRAGMGTGEFWANFGEEWVVDG